MTERNDRSADRFERGVARELQRTARVEPGADLDARVRRMILEAPAVVRPFLRPEVAGVVAMCALVIIIVGLGAALAETDLGEYGPLAASLGIAAYLAVSSVAVLPILLRYRNRAPIARVVREVR
jgi:hypothetical protein